MRIAASMRLEATSSLDPACMASSLRGSRALIATPTHLRRHRKSSVVGHPCLRFSTVCRSGGGGGQKPIPVVVNGAAGKMGREMIKAISRARGLELVGAVDVRHVGEDAGEVAGLDEPLEIPISNELVVVLTSVAQDKDRNGVLIDFSHPSSVMETFKQCIAFGVRPIIGTTGYTPKNLKEMVDYCDKATMGAIVSPSFSIGLAVMRQAAETAVFHYNHVEIFESNSDFSLDAPSQNAIITANSLSGLGRMYNQPPKGITQGADNGARGQIGEDGLRVHSTFNPGLLEEQEVRFGASGEMLSFKHSVSDYSAYVPGVILAIRRVVNIKTFVYGIERIL
mmetsp:Transcript_6828/g.11784  ORF Transcript_6828/g.11784 Transcript_6828/m.11784 type:complete len:338 (+) Transcript_6828:132-1145(+)